MKTVASLKNGQKGVIKTLIGDALSVKLLEMGCLPGKEISVIRNAPMGCPLYVKVGNSHLSLRKNEAMNMLIH